MSFNVLVIPEDFTKDQGILKPIVTEMLKRAGKPQAKIKICQNPRLGGLGQALDRARIAEVVGMYPLVDLFLLCVDRDGDHRRRRKLDGIEQHIADETNKVLLAEHAWQEVEVWVLAGLDLPKEWQWKAVRAEPNPKGAYFLPFAEQEDLAQTPDQGRKILAKRAVARFQRICALCPEDVQRLVDRIQAL